jgi:hypothetical protein
MAKKKNPIPKRMAGVKMPKTIRKSRMLRAMLASKRGRDLLADALVAGAGAAAAVLVKDREQVADAAETGAKKGARALGIAAEAMESAASAVMATVSDAANSLMPNRDRDRKHRNRKGGRAERHPVTH